MTTEAIKDFFIINGKMEKVADTNIFEKITKPLIYEVIRVINGIPIFLEEHLERFEKSARLTGYSVSRTVEEIIEDIERLISKNNIRNLNIKLLYTEIQGNENIFLVYFIKSYYPEPVLYEEGIHTILYHYEREKPNVKKLNLNFKENVNNRLKETNAFEGLLVNREGCITEGSRSNIFFVIRENVYTAPKDEVLLGITRSRVLEVCKKLDLKVLEENIFLEDLKIVDGAFMTGTSVNVLPITTIEEKTLNSVNNNIIKKISDEYIREIKNYILNKS
ncbi:MAG TPA: aminotransferase class IV [Tissierellales bacterium]|nr:aminotransferase class IV [Tissierellales bacterium]